jgi:hypothetical protein
MRHEVNRLLSDLQGVKQSRVFGRAIWRGTAYAEAHNVAAGKSLSLKQVNDLSAVARGELDA